MRQRRQANFEPPRLKWAAPPPWRRCGPARLAALDLVAQCQRTQRGTQAATHAVEQVQLQQLLQPRQFAADRGLRGVQQLGRPVTLPASINARNTSTWRCVRRCAATVANARQGSDRACRVHIRTNGSGTIRHLPACQTPGIMPLHEPVHRRPAPAGATPRHPRCGCTTPPPCASARPSCVPFDTIRCQLQRIAPAEADARAGRGGRRRVAGRDRSAPSPPGHAVGDSAWRRAVRHRVHRRRHRPHHAGTRGGWSASRSTPAPSTCCTSWPPPALAPGVAAHQPRFRPWAQQQDQHRRRAQQARHLARRPGCRRAGVRSGGLDAGPAHAHRLRRGLRPPAAGLRRMVGIWCGRLGLPGARHLRRRRAVHALTGRATRRIDTAHFTRCGTPRASARRQRWGHPVHAGDRAGPLPGGRGRMLLAEVRPSSAMGASFFMLVDAGFNELVRPADVRRPSTASRCSRARRRQVPPSAHGGGRPVVRVG